MNTGTQTEYDSGYSPGAEESSQQKRIFVNLRAGRIGQTSDKPLEGFKEHKSVNKAGTEYIFYAKTYDHLTGFVEDIRWNTHTLTDGTKLSGWNLTINAGETGVFVLGVNVKDRPFQQLMNCLLNVDFHKTVRFVGFWGKNQHNDKPQKVLLLTQGLDPDTKKPLWIKPAHDQKWLSRLLINKLKEKVPLTENEERNVSRMQDGSFNKNYPYIVQNADESWSFDVWNNFLHDQMEQIVIPAVKAAAEERSVRMPPSTIPTDDIPEVPEEFTGPASLPQTDDDIPF